MSKSLGNVERLRDALDACGRGDAAAALRAGALPLAARVLDDDAGAGSAAARGCGRRCAGALGAARRGRATARPSRGARDAAVARLRRRPRRRPRHARGRRRAVRPGARPQPSRRRRRAPPGRARRTRPTCSSTASTCSAWRPRRAPATARRRRSRALARGARRGPRGARLRARRRAARRDRRARLGRARHAAGPRVPPPLSAPTRPTSVYGRTPCARRCAGAGACGRSLHARARPRRCRWLETLGVPMRSRSRDALDALAGSPDHQGVVARVDPYPLRRRRRARGRPERRSCVALDGITDPQNLGAIARVARVRRRATGS